MGLPPNEFQYFAYKNDNGGFQRFMKSKIYTMANFEKEFSPARNFYTFYIL